MNGELRISEAIAGARLWWNRAGRHLMQARDLRNPDLGMSSGIMRGLRWDELSGPEQMRVLKVWHREIWRAG